MSSNEFKSINDKESFYDSKIYDSINYTKLTSSKDEFGKEYIKVLPSEGEIRLLYNGHINCEYYSMGFDSCRRSLIDKNASSFLQCKNALDAMFRCYTNNSEAKEYHLIRDVGKEYMKKFTDCAFSRNTILDNCMKHFEDSIRSIYRSKDHKLIDY